MPRLVVLEWDHTELRLLDTRTSGRDARVERAFIIPLAEGNDEGPSTVVADAISSAGFAKADAIVSIGRAGCQLRTYHVPKAPDDELPDMVRFQAMREFPNMGQTSAVDFLKLGEDDEHGIEVLVAVLSPELIRQVTQTVERAGLNLKRIVLRPFATAAHLIGGSHTSKPARSEVFLIVDQSSDETDLTVVLGSKVLTTRTVRIDANATDDQARQQTVQTLTSEIKRTLVAAKNQGSDIDHARILITGSETECAEQRKALSESLQSDVEIHNPFVHANLTHLDQPPHVGRFASLLGALDQEYGDHPLRIDFLNPRRKIEDHSGRRKWTFYGTLAAISLGVLLLLGYLPLHFKGNRIEKERQLLNELENSDVSTRQFTAEVAEVDEWVNREVVLLDEMYYLSYNLPPADRVILNSMSFKYPKRSADPTITIVGRVLGSETVAEIEDSLRDKDGVHRASGKVVKPVGGDKLYDHEFDETVTLSKDGLHNRINKK